MSLERLEFEGQIEEGSLVTLLLDLELYKKLKHIKLVNKGAFFNTKMLTSNPKLIDLGLFKRGHKIQRVSPDSSNLKI